jgi:hypothetical protein
MKGESYKQVLEEVEQDLLQPPEEIVRMEETVDEPELLELEARDDPRVPESDGQEQFQIDGSEEEVDLELDASVPAAVYDYTRRILSQGNPDLGFDEVYEGLFPTISGNKRRTTKSSLRKPRNREEAKQMEYRRCQRLWHKNRSQLADQILDDTPIESVEPPIAIVEDTYARRFEASSNPDRESFVPKPCENPELMVAPISTAEVIAALKDTRKDSAPGPDYWVTAEGLKACNPGTLAVLFSAWLRIGKVPKGLKECRTKLIPKGKVGLDNIGKWRPITIGSLLLRCYCKVLTRRISHGVKIHPLQNAFQPKDGCGFNTGLLNAIAKDARLRRKGLCWIMLDIEKAFDSVSHHTIRRALKRFNIPKALRKVIFDLYDGASTVIETAAGRTRPLSLNSGVKQGCPLSPILFNMIMDELFVRLGSDWGYDLGGTKVSVIGFADDTLLVSESKKGMDHILKMALGFFNARGLKVNGSKSQGFGQVHPPKHKAHTMKVITDDTWMIDGRWVPMLGVEESTRYLGVHFGPKGKVKAGLNDLKEWLTRLGKSPLKATQKVYMVRYHVLPRIRWVLVNFDLQKGLLIKADRMIRTAVKRFLHLPCGTANMFFYLNNADGGLGLMNLTNDVPKGKLKMYWRMLGADSEIVRVAGEREMSGKEAVMCLRMMGLEQVDRPSDINRAANRLYEQRRTNFCRTSQGRGFGVLRGSGNAWLNLGHPVMGSNDYIWACKLLTEQLPTREVMCRNSPVEIHLRCRGCGRVEGETQMHVLQQCPVSKPARMARHNRVMDEIARVARKRRNDDGSWQYRVLQEPVLRHKDEAGQEQKLKPDLVLIDEERGQINIVEVTVTYGTDENGLATAERTKEEKYQRLETTVRETFGMPVAEVRIGAMVVGAKGAVWRAKELWWLELFGAEYKPMMTRLSRLAVLGSVKTWLQFVGECLGPVG